MKRSIEYPLSKAHRLRLGIAFRDVPRVDLSIDCVLEGQMGRAFVDDLANPAVYMIRTGPFLYLAGDPSSPAREALLGEIEPYALLMPSAPGWLEAARAFFGDRWVEFDRYSFTSGNLNVQHLDGLLDGSPYREAIREMDAAFAARIWGQDHFVDLSEYDSPQDFAARGVGFYIDEGSAIVGAAFASLVCSRGIEISVYVEERRRRRGMATALACRLLRWCLERGMEPHWDAANPESCKLAMALGYRPAGSYPAHYLAPAHSPAPAHDLTPAQY